MIRVKCIRVLLNTIIICTNGVITQIAPSCVGPITIEPTEIKCPYIDCDVLKSCIRQCVDDACCRAGGVQEGSCVISYTINNTLHFNKIIPQSMGECLQTGRNMSAIYLKMPYPSLD